MAYTKPPSCTGCPVAHINSGFAFGEGPTTALVMLIGEALGEQEANEGKPFCGGTGRMLRMMLQQAGFTPADYYLTNVVKCRPPGNATPGPREIERCTMTYLNKEVSHVHPNIVVPVGDTALRHLLPNVPAGITQVRGHIFKSPYGKTIPIVHPSFVARGNPEFWAITVADLKRIKEHANSPIMPNRVEKFIINPALQDVLTTVEMLLSTGQEFAFDIETLGERNSINIICIGLAWSPHNGLCVPFLRRGGYNYWHNTWEEGQAWKALCRLFEGNNIKITQNGFTFDLPVLMDLGMQFKRHTVVDTLIGHHIVATELPHSLAFLTSIYTEMDYYKGDVKRHGGMLWAPDDVLRTYNVKDCIATYIAKQHIWAEMEELKIYAHPT